MYDQFTEEGMQVLYDAEKEARRFRRKRVSVEFLLLGVILSEGMGSQILRSHRVTIEDARGKLIKIAGKGPKKYKRSDYYPKTPFVKRILGASISEAENIGIRCVRSVHILLALLKIEKGLVPRLLKEFNLNPDKLREEILSELRLRRLTSEPLNRPRGGRRPAEPVLGMEQETKAQISVADFATDLTKRAANKQFDPVIGRDDVLKRVIQILLRRRKNNPVIIGEPGVGKTAIAEGLAQLIVRKTVPEKLLGSRLINLDIGLLLSGAIYRGQFEERLQTVFEEVKNNPKTIVVIDEIHTLVGAGAAEGTIDAANILKPALSRGEFRCLGATTIQEYRKYIEADAALARRFQPVLVEEPSVQETIEILNGIKDKYEEYHQVRYSKAAVEAAVRLSMQYLPDRFLPDKAIDVLDEAGSNYRIQFKRGEEEPRKYIWPMLYLLTLQNYWFALEYLGELSFWNILSLFQILNSPTKLKTLIPEFKEVNHRSLARLKVLLKMFNKTSYFYDWLNDENKQTFSTHKSHDGTASSFVATVYNQYMACKMSTIEQKNQDESNATAMQYTAYKNSLYRIYEKYKKETKNDFKVKRPKLSAQSTFYFNNLVNWEWQNFPSIWISSMYKWDEWKRLLNTRFHNDLNVNRMSSLLYKSAYYGSYANEMVIYYSNKLVEWFEEDALEDYIDVNTSALEKTHDNGGPQKKPKKAKYFLISAENVATVIANWTGIPVNSISREESEKLLNMEDHLRKKVIGQNDAISSVSNAIRGARVGLRNPNRPIASFIFAGPTGVGKTELAKVLAEYFFSLEKALIRFDMSEFMDKQNVSKLIGPPPGYIGYEDGGQLTEAVRRTPYSMILFDEIEKAHEDIYNLLLQILEDGRLTDGQGRTVDFKNTIIILTTNIGAELSNKASGDLALIQKKIDLGYPGAALEANYMYRNLIYEVTDELRKFFRPEFLNRLDEIIVFRQLSKPDLRKIANKMIDELCKRVRVKRITLRVSSDVRELIVNDAYTNNPTYGARPLRNAIGKAIEDKLALEYLQNDSMRFRRLITVNKNEKDEIIFKAYTL